MASPAKKIDYIPMEKRISCYILYSQLGTSARNDAVGSALCLFAITGVREQ